MMKLMATALVISTLTVPVLAGGHASGDADDGEDDFRQCRACHSIVDADGNNIVKGGATGPNLWGLPGRQAGTQEDFSRYGDDIVAAGEAGLVWDEENFVSFVQNPAEHLASVLEKNRARSMMSFRLRKEEDAFNIWAYIASVSPEPES